MNIYSKIDGTFIPVNIIWMLSSMCLFVITIFRIDSVLTTILVAACMLSMGYAFLFTEKAKDIRSKL